MPIKNGEQYRQSINRLKPNVVFRGNPVTGDISEHPAFRGLIATQSMLYDMQGQDEYIDRMTYPSPLMKEPVGLSFLPPKTRSDLKRRRVMMSLWADRHHGYLGRSPDYMNTALMAYFSAADLLAELNPEYADNLKNYYVYCRELDITLSHAFIQPIASRISMFRDEFEDSIAAKVHEYNKNGLVVSGAFLLATQGVTSEEILIFPTPTPSFGEDNPYTFAFAIPSNSPGLTFLCRESYVQGDSIYDYPLSSRFEEMDTLVLCDHVQVPRDRVFLYGDAGLAHAFIAESQFHAHVSHQILCRYIAKTKFFLGLVEYLVKSYALDSPAVREQVCEIITVLEILESMMTQAENKAAKNRWGIMVPNKNTMLVANYYFPKVYYRMVEIVQTLASSGLIMIPSEKDFQGSLASCLEKYFKLYDMDPQDVVALHRLAWELSASSFAGRQIQYERFFFGGPNTVTERLYSGYSSREKHLERIAHFLNL
ncbi:4-hydroxyphenylacetate 3-hydroxylase family protein [Alicyclobacillus macrosporangiidus]|uniref:4-hydroxyphenylacetate 3-hydroxylase family protein n=1 Tax=Alicyclobacillus macrosporangiidus TaxID=392015 RepID=UPI000495E569|nr:4-hydroxyphenylacetate 3-hydroxylase N-terminal domain-containing protein [Alicyclobacillus macrosporangiidus]